MSKKLLSIVIPAYREEKNISYIYKELLLVLVDLMHYDYEIIFVNDGSPDLTWLEIEKLCENDIRVKGVNLSRNFWHQAALSAWLDLVQGDVIVSMDCDMQHPPKIIQEMIQKYEMGNDIVYARVIDREVWFLKKYTSIWYYKILSLISDTEIPRNVWDFRLINRRVLDVFRWLKEKDRYIRGMMAWVWFKHDFVDFYIPKRIHGSSSYTWKKMWKLASDGILSFSTFPLKVGAFLGIAMILLSFLFFIYVVFDSLIFHVQYPLYKWLSIVWFWVMGLQFIFMWIIGEYVGRIYNESRERPIYIIMNKKNI